MLETRVSLFAWYRLFTVGSLILFVVALLAPLCMLYRYSVELPEFWTLPIKTEVVELDRGEGGALFPDEGRVPWIPSPDLLNALTFIDYNSRPDCAITERGVLIGLKGLKEERWVKEGSRIYLRCQKEGEFHFAEASSPYWVDISLHGDALQLNAGGAIKKLSKEGAPRKKVVRFHEVLGGARLLGPDRLFELYGGSGFQQEKSAYRLVLGKAEEGTLFVKERSLLLWHEGRWQLADKGETTGKPCAVVHLTPGQRAELKVWDERGIALSDITIALEKSLPITTKVPELFTKLHQRTKRSIICQVAGKSMILREGDWLVKDKNGWRLLQNSQELKQYLTYGLKGELSIFDQIVVKPQGSYFTGYIFDETRSQVQPIEIPLFDKKTATAATPKKRPALPVAKNS